MRDFFKKVIFNLIYQSYFLVATNCLSFHPNGDVYLFSMVYFITVTYVCRFSHEKDDKVLELETLTLIDVLFITRKNLLLRR